MERGINELAIGKVPDDTKAIFIRAARRERRGLCWALLILDLC